MLGYSEHAGQKGYVVRNLSTGKIEPAAYNQVHFYEHNIVYPPSPDYDEWLKKNIKRRDNDIVIPNLSHSESDLSDEESSDGDSDGDSSISDEKRDHFYEPNDFAADRENTVHDAKIANELSDSDNDDHDEDVLIMDYVKKENEDKYDDGDEMKMSRLELGEAAGPPPLSPYGTRSGADVSRAPVLPSVPAFSAGDSPFIDLHKSSEDTELEPDEDSEGTEEGFEVESIRAFRRVGKKRGRKEFLTVWSTGEQTWEPTSSFRLPGSKGEHIDVYDEFKRRMDTGGVSEYREGLSVDEGENAQGLGKEPSSSTQDKSHGNSSKLPALDTIALHAIAHRIELLALIVKAGIEVPESRKKAMSSDKWPEFRDAERIEVKAFNDMKVWELVPRPHGANVVGTRWVYDVKVDADGHVSRYKARLVAQGFSQKHGIDYTETFAPTMHIKTARVLFSIAARLGLEVRQYDISTAFLHASLKETVYVRQPPGYKIEGKENWVYRLNKAMYGLKNAPKAYSDHFMKVLSDLGFKQSLKDECLWSVRKGKSFIHYLFHVDDILCVSNDYIMRDAMFVALERVLRIRDEGPVKLFLGMVIDRLADGAFSLSQKHYIEKMAETFCITPESKPVETPAQLNHKLTENMLPQTEDERKIAEQLPFRQLVGALIYVTKTRPDVAYNVSDIARFMSNWGKEHFMAAMRILRYLYYTRDKTLLITPSSDPVSISVYVDANYGDDRDSGEIVDDKWKSQGGYLVLVNGSLVSWRSRRHKSRCYSSMEAEYMEASEAGKEVLWFRGLLSDLGYDLIEPTLMYEDNKACIAFSKNNTSHDRTKHIDIRAYALRDHVRDGHIEVVHIETKHQLADMLTKTQLKKTFLQHREQIFAGETTPPQYVKGGACRSMCACLSCFVGGTEGVVSAE